jgi:hypothetical protein
MTKADKLYGQDLKKQFIKANDHLVNLNIKIDKRFDMIVNDFPQYIDEAHKKIMSTGLDKNQKLEIIIKAEDNYIKETSNQTNLFN